MVGDNKSGKMNYVLYVKSTPQKKKYVKPNLREIEDHVYFAREGRSFGRNMSIFGINDLTYVFTDDDRDNGFVIPKPARKVFQDLRDAQRIYLANKKFEKKLGYNPGKHYKLPISIKKGIKNSDLGSVVNNFLLKTPKYEPLIMEQN